MRFNYLVLSVCLLLCSNNVIGQGNNSYGEIGRSFYDSLYKKIDKPYMKALAKSEGRPKNVFREIDFKTFLEKNLNQLIFPESVRIHCPERNDYSWFYFESDINKRYQEEYDNIDGIVEIIDGVLYYSRPYQLYAQNNLFSRVGFNWTEEAVWQYYLLCNTSYVLPYHGHSGYRARTYIFSSKDLKTVIKRIKSTPFVYHHMGLLIRRLNPKTWLHRNDIVPSVKVYNNRAIVECCYWNDWEGIIREKVCIRIVDGIPTYKVLKTRKLLPYNCFVYL